VRIEDRESRIEDRGWHVLAVLLALTCGVFAQQANRYGKITGRVLGEDGQPLRNAAVRIYPIGVTTGPQRSATTDDEGNFVFEQLPPRSYRLDASGRGYISPPEPEPKRYYYLGEHVTLKLVKGGVITGRVTDALGEPVPAVEVNAIRVRDADGLPVEISENWLSVRQTDDRGVYRIYGLPPGSYIVAANQRPGWYAPSGYEGEAPAYYPAATRDTAVEISVRSGEEATAIDIRYRGERGRVVSGKLTGAIVASGERLNSFSVQLKSFPLGAQVGFANVRPDDPRKAFAIYGVEDGEYELSVLHYADNDVRAAANPQRVVVKGADVTGFELSLAPLSTLAGRLIVEKPSAASDAGKCVKLRPLNFEEVLLRTHRADPGREAEPASRAARPLTTYDIAPNEKGEFTLRGLEAGRRRLEPRLPNDDWYVKAITLPTAAANNRAPNAPASQADAARNGFTLQPGENLTGVMVTVAEGAAGLSGKIAAATAGAKLPARLRVFMIPAEATAADEVLRYAETRLRGDGSFAFSKLAPGKYWLLARPAIDDESSERPLRLLAWDQAERLKLRREAEAAKQEVELTACQRVNDLTLKFKGSGQ
jgi:hypothetical protein